MTDYTIDGIDRQLECERRHVMGLDKGMREIRRESVLYCDRCGKTFSELCALAARTPLDNHTHSPAETCEDGGDHDWQEREQ